MCFLVRGCDWLLPEHFTASFDHDSKIAIFVVQVAGGFVCRQHGEVHLFQLNPLGEFFM